MLIPQTGYSVKWMVSITFISSFLFISHSLQTNWYSIYVLIYQYWLLSWIMSDTKIVFDLFPHSYLVSEYFITSHWNPDMKLSNCIIVQKKWAGIHLYELDPSTVPYVLTRHVRSSFSLNIRFPYVRYFFQSSMTFPSHFICQYILTK